MVALRRAFLASAAQCPMSQAWGRDGSTRTIISPPAQLAQGSGKLKRALLSASALLQQCSGAWCKNCCCCEHVRTRAEKKSREEALRVALFRKDHAVLGGRSLKLSCELHTTAGKTYLG